MQCLQTTDSCQDPLQQTITCLFCMCNKIITDLRKYIVVRNDVRKVPLNFSINVIILVQRRL